MIESAGRTLDDVISTLSALRNTEGGKTRVVYSGGAFTFRCVELPEDSGSMRVVILVGENGHAV